MKDRRSNVEGDILDEVLKNNGTRTNRNGALKGLQQYQTPPALANKLVEKLNIHPGQSVYDPQCAHGNLLHATLYHCHKFGVELDPTAIAFHRTSSTIVEGSTPKFEEVMDELIDPDWLVDFAVANPPFGLSWGGEDSTLWTFIHCVRHSNAGLLIGNASTIERLEIHKCDGVTAYETYDEVWDGVEVTAGVVYWKNTRQRVATNPIALEAKFELAAEVLEDERKDRKWNFWLDAYGRLQTYLSHSV